MNLVQSPNADDFGMTQTDRPRIRIKERPVHLIDDHWATGLLDDFNKASNLFFTERDPGRIVKVCQQNKVCFFGLDLLLQLRDIETVIFLTPSLDGNLAHPQPCISWRPTPAV